MKIISTTILLGCFLLVTLLEASFVSVDYDKECWPMADRMKRGNMYRGTQNTTVLGRTCKNWTGSRYWSSKYQARGIDNHNYCRNPAEDERPWCYTTTGVWDWCFVPTCGVDIGCWPKKDRSFEGSGYRGGQNVTVSSRLCKNWKDTSYYTEKYFNEGIGDHNYCRNPKENEDSVWCYKVTGGWDWCDVPTCSGCNCQKVTDTEFELTDMDYDLKSAKIVHMPPSIISTKEILNKKGSMPQKLKFTVEYSKSEEKSFTHTRGAEISWGAGFFVGVPLIAGAGVTYQDKRKTEYTVGEKKVTSKKMSSEFECTGAKRKNTKCIARLYKDKLEVPYVSTWTLKSDPKCQCHEYGTYEMESTTHMSMSTEEFKALV